MQIFGLKCCFITFLGVVLEFVLAEKLEDVSCKEIKTKSPHLQLKIRLFCNYDKETRPNLPDETNATEIDVTFMPQLFTHQDTPRHVVSLHTWTIMAWTDSRLTWIPENYDGIEIMHVSSADLWKPDLTTHNTAKFSNGFPTTDCNVDFHGGILCVPTVIYDALCSSDTSNWPFNLLNCTIKLASWSYTSNEVTFRLGYSMTDFKKNQKFDIISTKVSTTLEPFKLIPEYETRQCSFNIVLKRRGLHDHVFVALPSFTLMVLTLTLLWLDYNSTERFIIACVGFFYHLVVFQLDFWVIPRHSEPPSLIKFYERSLMIFAFSLVLTMVLRQLSSSTKPVPSWVASTTLFIFKSKLGQVFLLNILDPKVLRFLDAASENDDVDLVSSKKEDKTWNYVALLISFFTFIGVFITYSIMFATLFPRTDKLPSA